MYEDDKARETFMREAILPILKNVFPECEKRRRFENRVIIHDTRYRNSHRIDLGIGIKAGQFCTHRIKEFREKFREESNFLLYRVRESAPEESSRPEVATRRYGNKFEIWCALCEVNKVPGSRCGPESAECRSKDSRRCRKDRYHSSGSIRNGRSRVCRMHAKSTRYRTDIRSVGNVVPF
ncbi:hypothetical protein G5I_07183 [Acromyrmex echinatior]|uniref:Uncharacterized protein n=1 Tax=Acromyrmex echinatior TaxID=103372 RepID=F4WN36_ACREC|nr:hypothetical protein G5I_07183 [Acromyrmex echinatior]